MKIFETLRTAFRNAMFFVTYKINFVGKGRLNKLGKKIEKLYFTDEDRKELQIINEAFSLKNPWYTPDFKDCLTSDEYQKYLNRTKSSKYSYRRFCEGLPNDDVEIETELEITHHGNATENRLS